MSDTKNSAVPHTALHDISGLALIALGALLGTSAVMYMKGPTENPGSYTTLMSGFIEVFGAAAIIWICLGLVFVGGRLFLFGGERGLRRDAIGFTATGLALSVTLGADATKRLGGSFGSATGGAMTALTSSPTISIAFGVVLILVLAWVIWWRVAPPALVAKATELIGEDPAPETISESAARRQARNAPPLKPRTEDPLGVTSDEADALLPSAEREEIINALRTANRNSASSINHAPSPYPADVRREGGIPAGARPIETTNEPRSTPPIASPSGASVRSGSHAPSTSAAASGSGASGTGSVHTWSAPKHVPTQVGPGADLAGNKAARGAGGTARAPLAAELKAAPPPPAPEKVAREVARPLQGRTAAESARAIPILPADGQVRTPTWETEDTLDAELAEPEAAAQPGDAEVVDAYGTPLELVAELRGHVAKVEAPPAVAAAIVEDEVDEEVSDDDEFIAATRAMRADDEDEDEFEAEEQLADEVEVAIAPAGIDKVELEEDELDSDDEASLAVSAADLDEERLEGELAEAAAAAPVAPLAVAKPVEPAPIQAPPLPEPVAARIPAAVKEEREVVLQPVQASLFDAPAEKAAPAPAPAPAPRERTVVLDPQPAPEASPESKPADEDLVYRSGMLFLKHKRVAVSMLQREYGLDFKQATAVLDQLQEQGLIGPYLGGQRRDILLTAEEWRARVGAAS